MLVVRSFFILRRILRMSRYRTVDREATEVFAPTKIGRTQALTPEGFLLCVDVPIARVGTMLYRRGEVPVEAGDDGIAYVTRDERVLFDPMTLSSFSGKSLCDDHPPVDVDPTNWEMYSKGLVLNPRRGEGDEADCIIADLLITNAALIRDVQSGKREVSAGYAATYEQTGDGQGRQTSIIGNHVALVARGRCGPRCSIGDHDSLDPSTVKGTNTMATTKQSPGRVKLIPERIRELFARTGDQLADELAGMTEPDGDEPGGGGATHIHVHAGGAGASAAPAAPAGKTEDEPGAPAADPVMAALNEIKGGLATLSQRVDALEGKGKSAPPTGDSDADDINEGDGQGDTMPTDGGPTGKTQDAAGRTTDSAALESGFQTMIAEAELLVPGFRVPTFDSKQPRARTIDGMCQFRRSVLVQLSATRDGIALINSVSSKADPDLPKLGCSDIGAMFKAAAALKRAANNGAATKDSQTLPVPSLVMGRPASTTPAAMNEANKKFWAERNGAPA